ncbi:hypothetical protein [Micromonospora rubida]|uniref:hypothetical protein n=1 Tax=Micromonospora rubida TaxID=2697657 RepID=UPI001377199B|nr:hypothetical protein [Micromonospora rubida]NBE83533.1 hypothetical protein [Micromonospora rubida]
MTEHDDDQLLGRAFADFADGGPSVSPPGADGVRDTVLRRHRNRVTTAMVAGGLALVLPIAAFMGTGRGDPGPTTASGHRIPEVAGAPATASPSAAGPTSGSPTPSPSASRSPGRAISLGELTSAVVGVPEWAWSGPGQVTCSGGRIRLQPSGSVDGARVGVVALVQADLDDDPAPETAALLRCGYGAEQVVAYDRDDDGQIITLGRVVGTSAAMPSIVEVSRRSRGGITATVADTRAADDQRRQSRSYDWVGSRFTQVDGPTGFPPRVYPADLGLTVATPVPGPVTGKCEGQYRKVSVAFTVKNHGTHTSGRFWLEWRGGMFLPNGSYDSPDWLDTPGDPARNGGHRGLKRGESVTLTYTFKTDACVTDWGFTTDIHSDTPDPDPSNNHSVWWLRVR